MRLFFRAGELVFRLDNTASWFTSCQIQCIFKLEAAAAAPPGGTAGARLKLFREPGEEEEEAAAGGGGEAAERELSLTKAPGGSYTLWAV